MTEAPQNASTAAASAPEPQADQIQYLTPTPPGFAPEYDYFAVVQSLIDTAGIRESDSYESPFQPLDELLKNRKDTSSGTLLIQSSWSGTSHRLLPDLPRTTVRDMYGEIQSIRRLLVGKAQGAKTILIVDNISPTSLQIFGAAFDLDPTFLWRHYDEVLARPSWGLESEMNTLRKIFFSLVAAAKRRGAERDTFQKSSTVLDEDLHLNYRTSSNVIWGRGHYKISSHISCYLITANICKYHLLVRLIIS